MTARLVLQGVAKHFGATRALDGVELVAHAGEVHAIVGENGAGKSTLMKIIAGVHRCDRGTFKLDGVEVLVDSPQQAREAGIAIVHQEADLCDDLSLAENVFLAAEPRRLGGFFVDRGRMHQRYRNVMTELCSHERLEHLPAERSAAGLSAGDRQLLAIARALAASDGSPKVLILDEPTSSLTNEDRARLFEVIARLAARNICILYISHFLEQVQQIADRYTVLRDGKSISTGAIKETDLDCIIADMVGRPVQDIEARTPRHGGQELLRVTELAGQRLPVQATLSLRAGEVLGIAGLMGSGRSELLRSIFGLNVVRKGQVRVGNQSGHRSPKRRLLQGVGMLSEDRKGEGLAAEMSLADNITLSQLRGLGPAGFISPRRQHAAALEWIDRLQIRCQGPEQAVAALSGGNQQKVALARLLHHDVDVLLLDEPTRGIDVASRHEVYRQIDALAQAGKGILVVSSYLPELFAICDRIAVMRRGQLSPARATNAWSEEELMREAAVA